MAASVWWFLLSLVHTPGLGYTPDYRTSTSHRTLQDSLGQGGLAAYRLPASKLPGMEGRVCGVGIFAELMKDDTHPHLKDGHGQGVMTRHVVALDNPEEVLYLPKVWHWPPPGRSRVHLEYLDEHCGSSSIVQFSKDVLVDYSSYRNTVPADYTCQLSLQAREGAARQLQVHFRFLDTLQSPGCSVVGLKVSEGSTPLTPKNGVCGSRTPSVNYRTKGDTVTLQLTNNGQDTYVDFELLLTSFYYADRNNSCLGGDFRCNNGICISADLTCNGFDDCGDDSDEVEGCSLAAGIIVAIVFGAIFVFLFLCIFLVCLRRRRRMYLRLAEESQEIMAEHVHSLAVRCEVLEMKQALLKSTLHTLQKRSEWQDGYIRRQNLLFFGIPRTLTETREQCEAKVHEVIRTTMLVTEPVQLAHVHRRGSAVVVQFLSLRDKHLVLAHARNLRGKHVRISEDFPPRVREIRKGLVEMKNTYVAEGKSAKLRYDKLYTEFDVFTYDLDSKTVKKVQPQSRNSSDHGQSLAMPSVQRVSPVAEETAYPCSSSVSDA